MAGAFRLTKSSLQAKFAVFFALGFLLVSTVYGYVFYVENANVRSLYNARTNEETASLESKIDYSHKLTEVLATDYSVWDDPYMYLNGKLPDYAENNLTESVLDNFDADAMWMFYNDGRLASKINRVEGTEGETDFTPINQDIHQLFEKSPTIEFYMKSKTGIMHVFGSKVEPSDDPQYLKASPGYLLTGKLINDQELSKFQSNEVVFTKLLMPDQFKDYPAKLPVGSGKLVLTVGFTDIEGNKIGHVYANYQDDSIRALHNSSISLLVLHAVTYISLLSVMLILTWRWVVKPINTVYSSLESVDSSVLDKLVLEDTEFGKIAVLIDKFFEQEKLSEEEMLEKKKLLARLMASNTEIEQTNAVMVGRELKMIELKKEVELLKKELGEAKHE